VKADGIAAVYAAPGDRDAAFRWLDRAYRERSAGLVAPRAHQRWESSRDDPRLMALVKKIGLR
jgi:hypothetical protein